MASCTTSTFGSSSCPQVKLEVTISSETSTAATLSWKLKWVTSGSTVNSSNSKDYSVKIDGSTVKSGSFAIGGKTSCTIASGTKSISKGTSSKSVKFSLSFDMTFTWSGTYGGTKTASGSITVAAKPTYTITYNANGGSGAPSSQTKSAGASVTISSTKPSRTGYSFKGWNTSSTATSANTAYDGGKTYSTDANLTLYAVWAKLTYTVTYNANGGSGAPGNQTKTYDTNLTLSSTKPTKTNYTFKGWATTSGGGVAYASGATYTANSAVTLYAVWELAYAVPTISNLKVARCNSSGVLDEMGTYAKVTFDWSCNQLLGENKATRIEISMTNPSTGYTSVITRMYPSTINGSVSTTTGGTFTNDNSYPITVSVTDSQSGVGSKTATLSSTKFVLDFKSGGTGVAIGKAAEYDNFLDISLPTRFLLPDCITHEHSTSGKRVSFGVGSGGTNRGVYDAYKSKWMIYTDNTDLYMGVPSFSGYLKPYYAAGDSIAVNVNTAGYITSSGKQIKFTVSLDRPVLGNPTVSVSSRASVTVRQNGNYVYGSSSGSTTVTDSSNTSASISGSTLNVTLTFSSAASNAQNNSACGVAANLTITFG